MNSLTIFMAILVLAVDFSLVLNCAVCTGNNVVKKSRCGHYYCISCRKIFTQCTKCGKVIDFDNNDDTIGEDILKCTFCGLYTTLMTASCSHIFCQTCTSYTSNCRKCRKEFTIDTDECLSCSSCFAIRNLRIISNNIYCTNCISKGKHLRRTGGASSSRQNDVATEYINDSQNNESDSTNDTNVTLDSNGNPYYDFFK
ncbi:uncharacterized protein LOC126897467 isoform X4 [Daktulosphaira vitifoliae]|uniref:uncharacterized protein LOC126897467 isoform X4 n=1 Tax=Daktulosphaira vitifoliae TaxID=58002 RepID=UPI0021AA4A2D|nr:uncharacterized protein LOC126897467 isoform X4 [Daktulosphaira vitifoliae]